MNWGAWSAQSSSSSSSCAAPKPPAESSSQPSSVGPAPPEESSSSSSQSWLWILTTCVVVSRTVKPIVPSGLRPVFAVRSKNGSAKPRCCGSAIVPFTTELSMFLWTFTVSATPSPQDQTNARSSVPGSAAVTANSTGAPRPWSNTCLRRFLRSIVCVYVDVFSTLNTPENTRVPWPGSTRRHGSKLTQNGFDPDVLPASLAKATVALIV